MKVHFRIVKPILVSVNACVQYIFIGISTHLHAHTHRELLTESRHDREEQDSPQSVMERLLCDSAGCSMKGAV